LVEFSSVTVKKEEVKAAKNMESTSKSDQTIKTETKKIKKVTKSAGEEKTKGTVTSDQTASKVKKDSAQVAKAEKVDKNKGLLGTSGTAQKAEEEDKTKMAANKSEKDKDKTKLALSTKETNKKAVKEKSKTAVIVDKTMKSDTIKVTETDNSNIASYASVSKLSVPDSTTQKSKSTSDIVSDFGISKVSQNGSTSFEELHLNFTKCDLKVKEQHAPLLINTKVVNCTPRPFSRNSTVEQKTVSEGKKC